MLGHTAPRPSVQDDAPQPLLQSTKLTSKNVGRIYVLTALWAFSMAMWQAQMLSFYLYAINPDTRTVGVAEGVQGITRLSASMLIGVLVDRLPRNALIMVSSVLTTAVHAWILMLVAVPERLPGYPSHRMPLWYGSLALVALSFALQQNLVDATFADSVAHGDRVRPETRRRLITYLGLLCAPVVMIVMFAVGVVSDGDNPWTEATLRPIMLVGVCSGLLMGLMMASLDHNATLGAASEAVHVRDSLQSAQAAAEAAALGVSPPQPLPASAAAETTAEVVDATVEAAAEAAARSAQCVRSSIFIYDVLRLLSGGLVVKYWGLFFKEAYGLGPVAVLGIALGTIISMLALTLAAGFLSGQRVGAGRGAVCFGLLLLCDSFNFATVYARTVWADAASWIVREGALNGVFGLKKAILMDHTPKSRRGVWNAVDNLQSGFFSGSAIAGGFLIHHFGTFPLPTMHGLSQPGYRANFFFMSCGFVVATLAWAPLARVK